MTRDMEGEQKWEGFTEVQVTTLAKGKDVERRQKGTWGRTCMYDMTLFPLSALTLHVVTFLLRRLWVGTHLSQETDS